MFQFIVEYIFQRKRRSDAARFVFSNYWDFPVCALIGLAVLVWVGSLFIYHMRLIFQGRTTNEDIKGMYYGGTPFEQGDGIRSLKTVCFSSPPGSVVSHCVARKYITHLNAPPEVH